LPGSIGSLTSRNEAELREKVEVIARALDFLLPDDCLAAADMLGERLDATLKIVSEKQVLAVQLKETTVEGNNKMDSRDASLAKVAGLCGEAGCANRAISTPWQSAAGNAARQRTVATRS
jgi:hypothetical protein